jgi:hypothetical protein
MLFVSSIVPVCVNAQDLPQTQDSAAGAAVLMARAFIEADSALWRSIQNPKLAEKRELQSFIADIGSQMDQARELDDANRRGGPREITKVFAMGSLSANGPNSYAYATFDFKEIGFVDIVIRDNTGRESTNRTFVCLDQDSRWYVLPRPDLFPLLTMGLNQEPAVAKVIWSE